MTTQFKQTLILICLALLTSCENPEKQAEEKNKAVVEQKKEQLEAVNEKAIIDLSNKYNSVLGWEKIEPFTYVLQDKPRKVLWYNDWLCSNCQRERHYIA